MPATMTTLKPGLLVHLSTEVSGNTSYEKDEFETNKDDFGPLIIRRWKTTATTKDPVEEAQAIKVRGKCRSMITATCSHSDKFGLLCPIELRPAFDEAVENAQALARAFNRQAKVTNVTVNVIAGYIAPDDSQAVDSIRTEIRELIETMEGGILNLDVETAREAATRAKKLATILEPDSSNAILVAINATREAARRIVKANELGAGATAIDNNAVRTLRASRLSFLELDETNGTEATSFVPASSARAIELDWTSMIATKKTPKISTRDIPI